MKNKVLEGRRMRWGVTREKSVLWKTLVGVGTAAVSGILGGTGICQAANPFADVPEGHWSYPAVEQLWREGCLKGYPDGLFKGRKTVTRYELAQLIARAMSQGKIQAAHPLVQEYREELDGLGLRLARMEQREDQVQITGNIQFSYRQLSGKAFRKDDCENTLNDLRSRLFITGNIQPDWTYQVMLENNQYFKGKNESGDSDVDAQRLHLDGRLGAAELTAGRYEQVIAKGNFYDDNVDGIQLRWNGEESTLQLSGGKVANLSSFGWNPQPAIADTFFSVEASQKWNDIRFSAGYSHINNVRIEGGLQGNTQVLTAGVGYQQGKWQAQGIFLHGKNQYVEHRGANQNGYVLNLIYGNFAEQQQGTWNLYGAWYDQPAPTVLSHTMNGQYRIDPLHGFRGYMLGGILAIEKNIYGILEYYDLKGEKNHKNGRTLWTEIDFDF